MPATDPFSEAQERVKKLSRRPSNPELLDLYGLYKQATEGRREGEPTRPPRPRKGRAKFDAWTGRKGPPPGPDAKARATWRWSPSS